MTDKCPRCESPHPTLHPAVQFEGEVQLCRHPWHQPTADEIEAREAERRRVITTGPTRRSEKGSKTRNDHMIRQLYAALLAEPPASLSSIDADLMATLARHPAVQAALSAHADCGAPHACLIPCRWPECRDESKYWAESRPTNPPHVKLPSEGK